MEDLPVGSEITLKVVETKKLIVLAVSSMRQLAIFMKMFAEISFVVQILEKTERMFNSKELSSYDR